MREKNQRRFLAAGLMIAAVALASGMAGCAVLDQRSRAELEAAYGPNPPKMEDGYAARAVSQRDDWLVYIRGSDPDGDLLFIQVSLWIPGGNMTPIRLDVNPAHVRSVSGYLVLNTNDLPESLVRFGAGELRLMVALEDRAGHRSEIAAFPASFVTGARQGPAPQGRFEEQFLGSVPVQFIQVDSIGSGASWP
jgi:hypothetical protein